MATIDTYRNSIQQLFTQHANHKPACGEVEVELIFDQKRDRYLLFHVGWDNHKRIYGCLLHMDIKNEKIWIQYNGTEIDVAAELVALGVSKDDIVLAFLAPYKRQYTDFALG